MKHAIVAAAVLALTSGVAHADKKEKADTLFKQGKKLMGDKRYADACEAFEDSNKLDPAIGTQLNIAKCYEEWGKLARALLAYQAAEKQAKDSKDSREPKIKELIAALDPEVPRLTIKLPADAPKKLVVTLDRRPITVFGEPFVVDPGPHTIEYGVGGDKKQKIVPLERGGESLVTLDIPESMLAKDTGDPKDNGDGEGDGDGDGERRDGAKPIEPPPPTTPGRGLRIGGIALGGVGLVAIGVSSVMTFSARGKYNDALDMHCMGQKDMCNQMGLDITADARSSANTATIVFLVGAAAVGGGVAMYLLAPSGSSGDTEEQASRYLVPSISPDGAALVFGGRY